ncbi:Surfeitn 2 (SURF2) [Forsythia ovata]|uniref:Surfeitn 2 (SURF2) n=1 Tax=Forsythia ovata TaxID=205694 RepID=A0ABD1UEX1_9LAMI
MGKKEGGESKAEENSTVTKVKEGHNLLGLPTFEPLDNGRFKCVETGHELPAHARDSYAQSKHCRLGLIDSALAKNKPPLNMFLQDPLSRSNLKCKLTGVTINKTEEHIWKHINGRRFLNMLEKKEVEKEMSNGTVEKQGEEKETKKKKNKDDDLKRKNKDDGNKKKKKQEENGKVIAVLEDSTGTDVDLEVETDFWMPPVGERWDHDDGGEPENDDSVEEGAEAEEGKHDDRELSKRTKRMSLEIGPSNFASRKKKKKIGVA